MLQLIQELKKHGFSVWLDNGKIKLTQSRESISDELRGRIRANRDELANVLSSNQILSKEDFDRRTILTVANSQAKTSFAQNRLLFIEQFSQGTNVYNIPLVLELSPALDLDLFRDGINSIVQRHDVLRTIYKFDKSNNGDIYQLVSEDDMHFKQLTISEEALSSNLSDIINQHFDLLNELPIRVSFLDVESKNATDKSIAVIVFHHVAFDGWSTDVFISELTQYCATEGRNKLPALPIQYKDFSVWQHNLLSGDYLGDQLEFWKHTLQGYEPLDIPTDYPAPAQVDYSGDDVVAHIPEALSMALRNLAGEFSVSLNTIMLAGFNILLSKYCGQSDITLGMPLANRHVTELDRMIGFFVNSLTIRNQVNADDDVATLIISVNQNLIDAHSHQDLPFEQLVQGLNVEKDSSRHPIYQVVFSVQSFGAYEGTENDLFKPIDISDHYKVAKFALTFLVNDSFECLSINANYATSLFSHNTIEQLILHYKHVLDQMVESTHQNIGQICLLDSVKRSEILNQWNDLSCYLPAVCTLDQKFSELAKLYPTNTAVVCQQQYMSYQYLDDESNRLANYIRSQFQLTTGAEVVPGTLMALCTDRGLDMILGILGILKAGGAYVPIEPGYPDDRIDFILEDTHTKILLSQSHIDINTIDSVSLRIDLDLKGYCKSEKCLPNFTRSSTDLAYVIYTSGTTGKPKGVLQTHENVIRLFSASDSDYGFASTDVWTLFHSIVFDFSVWELWGALTYGGKLIIPTYSETRDTQSFVSLCQSESVTVLNQTPTAFAQFTHQMISSNTTLESLRYIVFGGESLSKAQVEPWWGRYGDQKTELVNMYGITETTVHVTLKRLIKGEFSHASNIGRPLSDMSVYILDAQMRPVPVGVVGEMYIGGAGLAVAYLNRADLTAERFIPNPHVLHNSDVNAETRLYRTGDLGKWLRNGELAYIGRNDFQVKVHGFRIELGEIERWLVEIEPISEAVVIANVKGAQTQLSAYFVASSPIAPDEVKASLSRNLPSYMIPAFVRQLEEMPINVNGKLDRKSLPDIKAEYIAATRFIAPQGALEREIAEIFKGILEMEKIGLHDNFFDLGANSINMMSACSQLREQLGQEIPLTMLFEHSTISRLAGFLSNSGQKESKLVAEEAQQMDLAKTRMKKAVSMMNLLEEA